VEALKGVSKTIPDHYRDGKLGRDWEAVEKACRVMVKGKGKRALAFPAALGKSLHLRPHTPVLSMVAVDLMRKLERLFKTLNEWDTLGHGKSKKDEEILGSKELAGTLRKVWFQALEVIVCLRLPVHEDSCHLGGNGRCWTASSASLTWIH
jgi:hypothetical protein